MIHSKKTYTRQGSDLAVYIIKVQFRSPSYTKFKAKLSHKLHGYVYETKNYKISNEILNSWTILEEK